MKTTQDKAAGTLTKKMSDADKTQILEAVEKELMGYGTNIVNFLAARYDIDDLMNEDFMKARIKDLIGIPSPQVLLTKPLKNNNNKGVTAEGGAGKTAQR
jgi:hypothetical protein